MKKIFEKLGLSEHITTELTLPKNEFIDKFKEMVDEREKGFFAGSPARPSTGREEFEGKVYENGFRVKRKKKSFEFTINEAVATGNFEQQGDKWVLKTEISGFSRKMIPFYLFIIPFYIVFIYAFLTSPDLDTEYRTYVALILFSSAILMFFLPYILMRNDTQSLKHDLEKEFFYILR